MNTHVSEDRWQGVGKIISDEIFYSGGRPYKTLQMSGYCVGPRNANKKKKT